MSVPAQGSDGTSNGSSFYADSANYPSWGRSSDRGRDAQKDKDLTVSRRRARKSGGFLMGNMFQPANHAANHPTRSSSQRSSRQGNMAVTATDDVVSPLPAPQTLDPSQLVQMALSLSESRRRRTSATLQVPPSSNNKRRVRSSGDPAIRASSGSTLPNDTTRPTSLDDSKFRPSATDTPELVDLHFSHATLQRAERARKFFDLSSEYRRLLSSLPPLKPANETSQKELGREYNPLQLLRNRKTRHREQRPLDPPAEVYDKVDRVRSYIDDIEHEASDATYRTTLDTCLLPSFHRISRSLDSPMAHSHKRSDTATSRISRFENDWSFTPSELLADAVWLLQAENRAYIEDKQGRRIFPQRPRSSFESGTSGRRSADSRPSFSRTNTWGSAIKSDDENDRGRKKPRFLTLRNVDHSARKHLFRNRSRSSSASSINSNRNRHYLDDTTGPLERQMQKLIERDRLGIQEDSSELISPDKWDKQTLANPSIPSIHTESPLVNSHKHNASSKTPYERSRSSFDDSTAPSSPVVASHIPSFGMSLSPPTSRQSSPERKFGLFRLSKDVFDDKIHRTDFADVSQIGENVDPPRSSFESSRPLGIVRRRTSNSITNSLFTSGRRRSKDVGVSRFFKAGRIGDFVRSDASRKKDRMQASDLSDSGTDGEEQDENRPRKIPPANTSNSAISKQNEKDRQRLHGLNMPTFRPSNRKNDGDTDQHHIARQSKHHREGSRSSRFDRMAPPHIKLPREDSASVSPTRKTPISRQNSDAGDRSDQDMLTPLRKNRSSQQPGEFEASIPIIEKTSPSPSRRPSPSKRHWSISDRHGTDTSEPDVATVTTLDIARVRALYLSSGIKAHEIILRANTVSKPPSPFFTKAAKTANQHLNPVCTKEEFTLAARTLHRAIKDQTLVLSKNLASFRATSIPKLHDKISNLRHEIDEKFTPLVHSTADEADAFTAALNTQHTLAVKQVNDAIDNVLRRRRRKLIFLQKASFNVLEWVVLGLMWGVWFVVIIIRFLRGCVGGVVGGVRWMLML
jgi:hypothetical protein